MDWVKHAQPPIVILENVSGAPWDKKDKIFEDELGYHADFVRLDTKHYYIPQVCSILNSSPVTALLHSHHDAALDGSVLHLTHLQSLPMRCSNLPPTIEQCTAYML